MMKIDNLHVYYDHVHALKGISLHIPQGKIVALLGANGAGKSTTLKAISGLVKPKLGTIEYQGESITKYRPSDIVKKGSSTVSKTVVFFRTLPLKKT